MAELELNQFINKLFDRIPLLQSVVISDRDGVAVVRVSNNESLDQDSVTFASVADQASKLQLGKAKSITTFYADRVQVHITHPPLILSFVGSQDINLGLLLAVADELRVVLEPLRQAIERQPAE